MAIYGYSKVECDCGQLLFLVPPDFPQSARDDITQVTGATVLICDGGTGACEACGRTYELPAAEVLDIERSKLGRWLQGLELE